MGGANQTKDWGTNAVRFHQVGQQAAYVHLLSKRYEAHLAPVGKEITELPDDKRHAAMTHFRKLQQHALKLKSIDDAGADPVDSHPAEAMLRELEIVDHFTPIGHARRP